MNEWPSRSNNIVKAVGNEEYTRMLSTGRPRHAEGRGFSAWRPDLTSERYPGTGYDFSGLSGFSQAAPSTPAPTLTSDPVGYLMNLFSPTGLGLIAIGTVVYFLLLRRE